MAPRAVDAHTRVFAALRQLGFREGEVKAGLAELRGDAALAGAPDERVLREASLSHSAASLKRPTSARCARRLLRRKGYGQPLIEGCSSSATATGRQTQLRNVDDETDAVGRTGFCEHHANSIDELSALGARESTEPAESGHPAPPATREPRLRPRSGPRRWRWR